MPHTILIVDDSKTTRNYVREELVRLGHEVIEAPDGLSALRVLEGTVPSLIISDVNMEPLNGLELVAQIRTRFSKAQLPILMLTTEAGDDLKAQGRSVGASGWLTKPFDRERMGAILAHLLRAPAGTR